MTIGEDDIFKATVALDEKIQELQNLIKWAEWSNMVWVDGVQYQACPWCCSTERLDRGHSERCPAFWAGGKPK